VALAQAPTDECAHRGTRVGAITGSIRRIALVALASKLIVALWRYLERGTIPQEATLKA
jgi:transposase